MTGSLILLWLLLLVAPGSSAAAEERSDRESRTSGIRFREVSRQWGIDFRHHQGGAGDFYMPESMASGVVIFDYDKDGDQDVLLIDGGAMPGYEGEPPRSRLYRNEGRGRFRDVSERAGIEVTGYGMGATAGDTDGDGDQDLYVTAWGKNQLFRNEGDGTFTDVTATAGVGGDEEMWTASAAFADVDGDGDLDLYATNYVNFTYDNNPFCGHKELDLRSYCHPDVYDGLPDVFFRNGGDGTFVDDTEGAGFSGAAGKGLGVIFGDLDRDGWIDLYVANDMTANFLFRNRRDGTFEEEGLFSGVAFSDQGAPEAGMGVDMADVDGDGLVEIIVTHLDMQSNALYSSSESGLFADRRHRSRLAEVSRLKVGFGVAFGDFDRDADVDLVVANGHIIHNIELYGTGGTYRQRNQAFENRGDGRFDLVEEAGFEAVRASRGLAIGDLDGDGDLEVVVNNLDEEVEVYENLSSSGGWLGVDLRASGANRRALGARLELRGGGFRQVREVRSASSYLSQNATTVHFGLGKEPSGELEMTVHWPGGPEQLLRRLPINRRLMLFKRTGAGH